MPPKTAGERYRTYAGATANEWRKWAQRQTQIYMDMLRAQARIERHARRVAESRATYQRKAGMTAGTQARTKQEQIGSMQREIGVQSEIARWGSAMGLEATALEATRSIIWLQEQIALLSAEIQRAPFEDAAARARQWSDELGARVELMESMRAPASDVQRLMAARVRALESEAQALRGLGKYAAADRALAQAARLSFEDREDRRKGAIDERIRQVIGGDVRDAQRVSDLAVSEYGAEGGGRRYVVEFQAPGDGGAAIADAVIDQVMRRLGDVLRSQR